MSEGLQVLVFSWVAVVVVSAGVFLSALATRRGFHSQEEARLVSVVKTFRELLEVVKR